MLVAVGVGVDDAFHSLSLGVLPQAPVEVETVRVGVELEPGAGRGAGVDDGVLVDGIGFAAEQQPAGEVAEHVDVGVLRGSDEAAGVVGLVAAGDVQAGNNDVELGEQGVVKIELGFEDVHLDAAEQAEGVAVGLELLVDARDLGDLFAEPRLVEAVGLERCARVVGDGPVVAAQPAHVVGDLLERLGAVAPVGVVVQRALEIGPLDEARDFARLAGVELTLVLAQLRRDVGEVERGEDVLLGFAV